MGGAVAVRAVRALVFIVSIIPVGVHTAGVCRSTKARCGRPKIRSDLAALSAHLTKPSPLKSQAKLVGVVAWGLEIY